MNDSFWGEKSYSEVNEEDPSDLFFDDLISRHTQEWVEFVTRLFYLRRCKDVHGEYPIEIDYIEHRCLLALETEIELREAFEHYRLQEKHKQDMQNAKSKAPANFGRSNTF